MNADGDRRERGGGISISGVRNFSLQMYALIEHSPCCFIGFALASWTMFAQFIHLSRKGGHLDIGNPTAPFSPAPWFWGCAEGLDIMDC